MFCGLLYTINYFRISINECNIRENESKIVNTEDQHIEEPLWLITCTLVPIVFSILSREACVYVSQLALTGTVECNKSQRKLASTRCTFIHSILLSLCALFSPSPTLKHWTCILKCTRDPKYAWMHTGMLIGKIHNAVHTHSQAHTDRMHASCADTYWFVHGQTHTYTLILPRGLVAQCEADIWRFSTWSSS